MVVPVYPILVYGKLFVHSAAPDAGLRYRRIAAFQRDGGAFCG